MTTEKIKARRVVVIGAASGIGAATAGLFAGKGDQVVGLDLRTPPECEWPMIRADVASAAETEAAIRQAVERMKGLDILVYCAGITERGNVEQTSLEVWDRVFDVNVRGAYVAARMAVPYLRESACASIVNVASQFAFMVNRQYAAYCASKAALLQLSRAMALDYGPEGIRVNAVCPGPTDTPMLRGDLDAGGTAAEGARAAIARTLTGEAVDPQAVASAIEYLTSEAARSVIGASLVIDAGFSIA